MLLLLIARIIAPPSPSHHTQYWEPGEHTVTVIWILRDKGLIAQLIPCMNPATKVILHYTGKKTDPETGKKVQDMLNEDDHHDVAFFDRPEVRSGAVR